MQRQIPSQSEALRTQILASLPPKPAIQKMTTPKINFAWLSLALAGFAVLAFFIIPTLTTNLKVNRTSFLMTAAPVPQADKAALPGQQRLNSTQSNLSAGSAEIWPQPLPPQTTPSSDTREFLKTSYSANIQTRNVQDLADRLQTTIRGFGGRVDASSNSTQSGYISFVVPAGQFEAFRQQIKGLVNYRFYSESSQTENLLPQKRDIESQQTQTNSTLAQLQSDKNQLTQNHNSTIASLNLQIRTATKQLTDLQNQTTTDVYTAMQIQAQKQDLANQIKNLQDKLSKENYTYSGQLNSLNFQIQDQQNLLDNLNTQTNNLLDNVATVNGTISLSWISAWDVFNLYVPAGYWVPGLLLILAVAAYFLNRRQSQFIFP